MTGLIIYIGCGMSDVNLTEENKAIILSISVQNPSWSVGAYLLKTIFVSNSL